MEKNLFRGKKFKTSVFDKTDWIYGSLIDSGNHEQVAIYPWLNGASTMSVRQLVYARMEAVKPETVGKFTGMTDIGGKEIFEGDIMKTAVTGLHPHTGVVEYAEGSFGLRCTDKAAFFLCYVAGCYTIIGNIHDNPELLPKNSAIDSPSANP